MECAACGSKMRDDARMCLACGEILRPKVAPYDRLEVAPAGVPTWFAFEAKLKPGDVMLGAGRPARALAFVVDLTILGVVGWLIAVLLGGTTMQANIDGDYVVDWRVLIPLIIVQAAYAIVFPATSWSGTPGKRLLGLRIVDMRKQPISIFQSTFRYLLQQAWFWIGIPLTILGVSFSPWAFLPFVAVVAVAVGFWMICTNGRSPWDWMAGTQVVE